ncbi:hypothetical protein HYY69_02210 [Candidatus Woesearchaeota archaeon]|nr:hypothetical protein [Candidatus Woesearchaeota archaeon]
MKSQQTIVLLDAQLKNAFKAVKQDISRLDKKVDSTRYDEVKTEINKVHTIVDNELKKLKEQLKNLKKELKENFKEITNKVKNESATKNDIASLENELEEYAIKVKKNFIKAADKFKEVESNTIELDEVKAAFLTKETVEKQLESLKESLMQDREKEINNVKKQVDKATSDFHDKVNGMQKELDDVHDKVTTLSKRAEVLVHKEELAKASENFIEIDEFNKILDNIETLKKEFYEKPEETTTKEKDELFKRQMEKTANDIHDKVNNLRKELDSVHEKVTKVQEKMEKTIDQEELLKISRGFVNIEEHNKVHEKIDAVKEMLNTVQFSDTEVKKLRSNVDKIILALVPKKEHDKSMENIHKKLQSLKEDIDEIDKKVK